MIVSEEIYQYRFWQKVNKSDFCWEWTGALNKGYGYFRYMDKSHSAHRLSYIWVNGSIPANWVVCHKCDNAKCVNPSHLFTGTHADNVKDKVLKNRGACGPQVSHKGERHPASKLTNEDVLKMRLDHSLGFKQKELAILFNVSTNTVCKIIKRKAWTHI